jgi:hypothetical protein
MGAEVRVEVEAASPPAAAPPGPVVIIIGRWKLLDPD